MPVKIFGALYRSVGRSGSGVASVDHCVDDWGGGRIFIRHDI